ncbi:conserved phage C-terminal domain-containing protein [Lactobacillus sp. ESL0679]|uniref:conserved phage C-terminal domain-containing protein n=1 Tax=Lactobacillus sp. ESL0679 TaxID=2983209 RepID=UPI0023F7F5CA|nr:conserved phage C-terminal domain-containing protein [Lactobacillus sp. ESL0679]MDF7683381.1 conserved phage C-terminal domain-containing protein [Lactobacillus sp. ESL0679]
MVKILRNKRNLYVNVSQQIVSDNRLSWKARGIFVYLWGQSDNWQFYFKEVAKHAKDGEEALRTGIKELQTYGYLKIVNKHDKDGSFAGKSWILSDYVHRDGGFPEHGKIGNNSPKSAENTEHGKNRTSGNPALTNINSNYYQEVTSKDIDSPAKAEPPVLQKNNSVFKQVVDYLNKKAHRDFKYTNKSTQRLINARVNDGFDVPDFKKVIDTKCAEWLNDKKMYRYLRPDTLFGPKFEGYLNEKAPIANSEHEIDPRMLATVPDVDEDDLPF